MSLLSLVIAVLLNLVSAQSPLAHTEIGQSKSLAKDYLLPSHVKPSLYQVKLEPNFDFDIFNGSVRITISVVTTTNAVVLHTHQLTIETASISLLDVNGTVVNSVAGTSFSNDDKDFYNIGFEEDLVAGSVYTLVIDSFSGILNSENDGFYLAKYTDEEGNTKKLATTDFEPTSARRAFPCFDEPALKAQFDISIIRTAKYNSISNMPQVSTHEISTGRFLDKYARSVIMSTYVVAFVVSNFDCAANLNHRIFLRPALIANRTADYAIGVSTGILEAIADFVNVPYSLEKMDQIGIPDDYFSVGAMENWGLVIYSEEFLVHVNRLTLATSKQTTITFISHEFGHQWFGNLVSPLWWTYVWLSEGFATYFQYYGASVVDGSMDLMDQMVIKCVQKALGEDDTTSTRPMNLEVGSPDDINSLFDHVAYRKSGSVIRMVEGVMTTKAFRIGLNHYLNKMQYGAAEPSDLYSSCQAALDSVNMNPFQENVNMASVMRTWDSNAGFPLVTVTRDYAVGSIHLYQRRFISANQKNYDESIWYVPISYGTTTNPDPLNRTPKLWLTGRNLTTTIEDLNIDDWLLINIQETGYYRVNYDVENCNRISDYSETCLKRNRLGPKYFPLYTGFRFTQTFISNTLNAAMTAVGCDERENDRHVSILSRSSLLTWTGKFGNEACREVGLQRIREWAQDQGKSISPNLQRALTCTGLRIAEQSDWDFIFDRYVNEPEALKNIDLLLALGCSENIEIFDRFLDRILDSNSDLRSEHRIIALSSICYSGKFGRDYLIYNYITNNWTKVTSGSLTTSQIASAMRHIAVRSSTEQQYKDLDAFGQQVGYNFTDALNTIRSNMNWSNQHMPAILNWFNKMYKLQL